MVTGLDITGDGRNRLRLSPQGLPPRTFLEVSQRRNCAESRGEVILRGWRELFGPAGAAGHEKAWSAAWRGRPSGSLQDAGSRSGPRHPRFSEWTAADARCSGLGYRGTTRPPDRALEPVS